ncbi:GPW/gp25 family protein [soil metagenome]
MNGMDAHTGKLIGGADHLRQSVGDILGTPLGSRIARRDYGSLLPELLDQPDNALTRLRIFAASALALQRQESRLRSSRFALQRGATPGAAILTISGTRTDTGRPAASVTFSVPVRSLSALSA